MNKKLSVYAINTEICDQEIDITSISDEEFMSISKELNTVYTLKEFEKEFNSFDLLNPSEINPIEVYIRIL